MVIIQHSTFFVACLMSHFVALIFDFRSTLRVPTIYRICVRWFFRRIRVFTLISFTIYWCKCVSPVLPIFPAILSWTWSKALNLRTDMKPIFKIDLYLVRVDFRMFSFNFLNHKTHNICFGKVSWNRISSNSSDKFSQTFSSVKLNICWHAARILFQSHY